MWQASGVADVKEAEKRLKHKLRPLNAWRLILYFELFLPCLKHELHQWYVLITSICIDSTLFHDHNFNVACETGIRYQTYEVMSQQEKQVLRISVSQNIYTSVIPWIHYV